MTTQLNTVVVSPNLDNLEHALSIFKEHGCILIKGLYKNEADALNSDLERHMIAREAGIKHLPERLQEFAGKKTKRLSKVPLISPTFREKMLDNPFLNDCVDLVFKDVCAAPWLGTAQIMEVLPGEKAQELHRDVENYQFIRNMGKDGPEVTINAIVALTDITEEMGATRLILGSHRWDDFDQHGQSEDTIPLLLEKGDAFLFSGKLIHGAGANVSNKPRRAMAMAFNAGWLTPEEAVPMYLSWDLVKTLSPRAQQLLGFRSFHGTEKSGGSLWTVDYEELGEYMKSTEKAS